MPLAAPAGKILGVGAMDVAAVSARGRVGRWLCRSEPEGDQNSCRALDGVRWRICCEARTGLSIGGLATAGHQCPECQTGMRP